ncbi:hypothetical protein [Haloactinopolyspora sp.]|uniref:hypothetical protein n=1 Tax=Haloactinopolyspora sp. TaxID=1966353 RepID=UPI0026342CB5|nr:hypothetical protein [Haloactinopolyspora sp.]
MSRLSRSAAVAVAVALSVTACSNTDEPEVPVVPTQGASPSDDGSAGDAAATPSPTSTTGVPELCEDLATAGEVAKILKVPMRGETQRVYNDDYLGDSGRTGRLTCKYGVRPTPEGRNAPPTPAPVPLTVAVSGYVDGDVAAGRISSTVDDAQAAGTTVQAQSVAGRDGFLLSDKQDVSFVVADDVRTYVITLSHGVVAKPAERVVLLDMAHHLLGIPPSTSAATATA